MRAYMRRALGPYSARRGAGIGRAFAGLSRIDRLFRARNLFERFVLVVLIACALIAILTTIGIIFSVCPRRALLLRSQGKPPSRVPVRHRMEPAGGAARRPGRHPPPSASFRCWSARCSSPSSPCAWPGRSACCRRSTSPSMRAARPRILQAGARDAGRHPDRRPRLLRRAHGRAAHPRPGRVSSASTSPPRARWPPASSWA